MKQCLMKHIETSVMTLKEIREECWDYARDNVGSDSDKLWNTAEMNRYINRIYRHIARETRCIRDAVTPEICNITVAPRDWTTLTPEDGIDYVYVNSPESWLYHQDVAPIVYKLDPRILQIEEVKWTNRQWRLTKVSVSKWQSNPWWEQVVGMPTEYATDYSNNTLVLNYRETLSDALRLQVKRLPLKDLIDDDDLPEFRDHYHDYFKNGVLWLMYRKQDSEAEDKAKSSDYFKMFAEDLDQLKQSEAKLEYRLFPNNSLSAFR